MLEKVRATEIVDKNVRAEGACRGAIVLMGTIHTIVFTDKTGLT